MNYRKVGYFIRWVIAVLLLAGVWKFEHPVTATVITLLVMVSELNHFMILGLANIHDKRNDATKDLIQRFLSVKIR